MKLEINKRYVLRDGRVTEPLEFNSPGNYPFVAKITNTDDYLSWTADGRHYADSDGNSVDSNKDIIALFGEVQPETSVNDGLTLHALEVARIALRLPRVAVMIADELDLSDEAMHEIISFLESKLK